MPKAGQHSLNNVADRSNKQRREEAEAVKGGMRYEKGPMSFSGNLLPLYASLMRDTLETLLRRGGDAAWPAATSASSPSFDARSSAEKSRAANK